MQTIPTDPVQIAARTAWGEARGEGLLGMQAVMNTFANRALTPAWWGRDIAGVCLCQNKVGIHQYSCWNIADPNRAQLLAVTETDPQFKAALALAQELVEGSLSDLTKGADSYYDARSMEAPRWAETRFYRCTIGHHAFYRVGPFGEG